MKPHTFRDLRIWSLGMDIFLAIDGLSKTWPRSELFSLTSQIRRSALSIPSNIAEGYGRYSQKDFTRFLQISLGSCYEVETQLEIAFRLEYLSAKQFEDAQKQIQYEIKMIKKLVFSANSRL